MIMSPQQTCCQHHQLALGEAVPHIFREVCEHKWASSPQPVLTSVPGCIGLLYLWGRPVHFSKLYDVGVHSKIMVHLSHPHSCTDMTGHVPWGTPWDALSPKSLTCEAHNRSHVAVHYREGAGNQCCAQYCIDAAKCMSALGTLTQKSVTAGIKGIHLSGHQAEA